MNNHVSVLLFLQIEVATVHHSNMMTASCNIFPFCKNIVYYMVFGEQATVEFRAKCICINDCNNVQNSSLKF